APAPAVVDRLARRPGLAGLRVADRRRPRREPVRHAADPGVHARHLRSLLREPAREDRDRRKPEPEVRAGPAGPVLGGGPQHHVRLPERRLCGHPALLGGSMERFLRRLTDREDGIAMVTAVMVVFLVMMFSLVLVQLSMHN